MVEYKRVILVANYWIMKEIIEIRSLVEWTRRSKLIFRWKLKSFSRWLIYKEELFWNNEIFSNSIYFPIFSHFLLYRCPGIGKEQHSSHTFFLNYNISLSAQLSCHPRDGKSERYFARCNWGCQDLYPKVQQNFRCIKFHGNIQDLAEREYFRKEIISVL